MPEAINMIVVRSRWN